MLRGFYTAASGMIAQQRRQEAMGNNIANANTPGYKADQETLRAFPEMLMQEMGSSKKPGKNGMNIPGKNPLGSLHTGVYEQEMVPDFKQGDKQETGNPTDLALDNGTLPDEEGGLFFAVQDGDGDNALTRNGHFTVDEEGYLTTTQGNYVLDTANNPIQTGGTDFTVTEDGEVQTDAGNVALKIAYTPDADQLEKAGDGLFNGETEAADDANFSIEQGALEQSNVDANESMTDMMTSYRSFETNQRALKAYDESMGKAVSEVGQVR